MRRNLLLFQWLFFIGYAVLIFWLSLTPSPPEIEGPLLGWDKFQHTAVYTLFTLLAGGAFGSFSLERKRRWLIAVAVAVSFGGLLEILQGAFTRTRTAEWGDLLADLIGACCAYCLVMLTNHYRRS